MTKRELEAMVLSLQAENARLMEWATAEIAKRDAIIERQAVRIAELEKTVAALAAQIRANSSNSSKPPSSDGPKKPAPKSLRKNTGKKPGGQAGHQGHGLKLKAEIDRVAPCLPLQCASCPQRDECAFRVRDRRNVLDIMIRLERTEYQQMETVCPLSGRRIAGEFPEGIAGTKQYGPSLKALAAILVMECAVGLEKSSQVIRGLTGCSLRKSSILNHLRACAAKLEAPMDYLREQILGSPVVNFDETGIRVGGKLQYLNTASTASTTCLTASSLRGKQGMDEGQVLPRYRGIAVHDCWLSYWKYEGISAHGVCAPICCANARGFTRCTRTSSSSASFLRCSWACRRQRIVASGTERRMPGHTTCESTWLSMTT